MDLNGIKWKFRTEFPFRVRFWLRKWNSRDGISIFGTENGNSIFGPKMDPFSPENGSIFGPKWIHFGQKMDSFLARKWIHFWPEMDSV